MDLVPIPNDVSILDTIDPRLEHIPILGAKSAIVLPIGAIFGGTVFGCLRCLTWNFLFPSPTELLLWGICSILMTTLPILFSPLAWVVRGVHVTRFLGLM